MSAIQLKSKRARIILGLAQAFSTLCETKKGKRSLQGILGLVYAERCYQASVIVKRESSSSTDNVLLLATLISLLDDTISRDLLHHVLVSRIERVVLTESEVIPIKGPSRRDIERVAGEISTMLIRQIVQNVENGGDGGMNTSRHFLQLRRVLVAAAYVGLLSDQGTNSSISAVLYSTIILWLLHASKSALLRLNMNLSPFPSDSDTETHREERLLQASALISAAVFFLEDASLSLSLCKNDSMNMNSYGGFGRLSRSGNDLIDMIPTILIERKRTATHIEADTAELLLVLVAGGVVEGKGQGAGALSLRQIVLDIMAPTINMTSDEAQSFLKLDRALSNLLDTSQWSHE
jgi:hypothetical protein